MFVIALSLCTYSGTLSLFQPDELYFEEGDIIYISDMVSI